MKTRHEKRAADMNKRLAIVLALLVCLAIGPGLMEAAADGHKRERREHGHRGPAASTNPLYQDRCGGCHLAYPPGLLPAGSWRAIIAGQADHYGENLDLTPDEQKQLTACLTANAADRSGSKVSRKIMRSLGAATPLRITEVPYIIHKHEDDDVPPGAFQRKSVGSFGNCGACHPGAAIGDFDDDAVRIPAK